MSPRILTQEELDTFTKVMGWIDFEAPIFLWLGVEPFISHQTPPPPQQPETMIPPLLRRVGLNTHPLEDFDCAILLWLGVVDPARLFPQYEIFQIPPPPPLSMTTQHRVLTRPEIESFTDNIRGTDLSTILLWQGIHPARIFPNFPMFQTPPPPKPSHILTEAEFAAFTHGSGVIDYYAYLLGYQSKGLSEEGISKLLKTMNADEIRAHDKDGDRKICAVCLDDVCRRQDDDDKLVAILDECGHEFHSRCLEKWLRRKNICPLCRRTAISLLCMAKRSR